MATGLEILGAAAAIAQFIGYTISLGKDAAAVYKSSGGTTEEIEYRGNWIQRFQSENKEMLARDKKRLMPRDTTEESIHQLAQDSQDAAMELLNVLRSLRLQGPSQNDDFIKKASKSFGVAFKAKRWQQEINSKTQRLQKLREQLHEQLLRLIRSGRSPNMPIPGQTVADSMSLVIGLPLKYHKALNMSKRRSGMLLLQQMLKPMTQEKNFCMQ